MNSILRLPLCAVLVLSAACSGGGGGGGGGPTEPVLDEGAYSTSEFSFVDPHAPTFHPLTTPRFSVSAYDEVMGFTTQVGDSWDGRQWDDADHGTGMIGASSDAIPIKATLVASYGADVELLHAGAGELDGEPGDELVVLVYAPSDGSWDLVVYSQLVLGQYDLVGQQRAWSRSCPSRFGRLRIADIDQDGRFDVVVSCEARFGGAASDGLASVFLSLPGIAPPITLSLRFQMEATNSAAVEQTWQFVPGNFDERDPEFELVLSRHASNLSTDYAVYDYDPVTTNIVTRRPFTDLHPGQNGLDQPVRVQFDRDAADEIAFCGDRNRVYEMDASYQLVVAVDQPGFTNNLLWPTTARVDAIEAVDFDGDQVEEIAVSAFRLVDRVWGLVFSGQARTPWSITGNQWSAVTSSPSVDFTQVDRDADGKGELWVVEAANSYGTRGFFQQPTHLAAVLGVDAGTTYYPVVGGNSVPVAVGGDFDAEGLTLEFTGTKSVQVADPIPIVLMAAAPTKSGISQDYGSSSTAYGTSSSQTTTAAVTTGPTLSYEIGLRAGVENVFKLGVKAKLELEMKKTLENTHSVTTTQIYTGGADTDVVVFQGTLYQSYHYLVIASAEPALLGQIITIDTPVEARLYKWTLPYYRAAVPGAPDLTGILAHTIGDPASYRGLGAASAVLAAHQGWPAGDLLTSGITVGQGSGSTIREIELETATSTEHERTLTVGGEISIEAGPLSVSEGLDWTFGWTYAVEFTETTQFSGSIGDIALPADYSAWNYTWGLFAYKFGQDQDGEPLPGTIPVVVIDYWTVPTGSAY